jgi:hypothetical protein
MSSAGPADDETEDLCLLLNSMQVSVESVRSRAEIDVVVQAWTELEDAETIVHRCPVTLSLKPDETLFAMLDRYIKCARWGVLSTDDRVWYIHHADHRFDPRRAENSLSLLEHSIRHRDRASVPCILIEDLR